MSFQVGKLESLKFLVRCAVMEFMINDWQELLELDVHEVTLTHRIALYLEMKFKNYDVDLEYNRAGREVKRVRLKREEENIRPDIIIHRRNTDDNLCVIEVKKNQYSEDDIKRIKLLLKDFNYRLGLFLKVSVDEIELHWLHYKGKFYRERESLTINMID